MIQALSNQLLTRCRDALLQCSEFDNNASLRAVFVTEQIAPFRSGLPEAASKGKRVDACLDYLLPKHLSDGRPVLPLFIAALRDRYEPGDALRDELETLCQDVEDAIKADKPELPAPGKLQPQPVSSVLEPPTAVPVKGISLPDPGELQKCFRRLGAGLATLHSDLPGPPYESSELAKLAERCLQPDRKQGHILLITEEPGGGKTVFLSLLYHRLIEQIPVLAIQPERYPENGDLAEQVETLMEQALALGPAVLLLDSLDMLASARMPELQCWLRLLDRFELRPNLTVVAACRTFEARYVPPLCSQQWSQVVAIGLPPTNWVDQVLQATAGVGLASLPEPIGELLRVPLHLVMAIEIAKGGGRLDDLTSVHALYGRLMHVRGIDAEDWQVLSAVASEMLSRRVADLPRSLVPDASRVDRLAHSGLIEIEGRVVRFRHQTTRDYIVARRVVDGDETVREFLDEFGQSLVVHPILRHLVGLVRQQPRRLSRELCDLLTHSAVRFHIKAGILGIMASWPDPSKAESALLIRLFRQGDERWETLFFSYAPTPGWLPHLLDSHLRPAAVDKVFGDNARSCALNYLTQVAPSRPTEVLGIATELLKQPPDRFLSSFFHRLQEALAPMDLSLNDRSAFADVLSGAVERAFQSFSFSIVIYCQKLAAIEPERALRLFFSTLRRQLAEGVTGSDGLAWNESVGGQFEGFLLQIYEQLPYETLLACFDLLETLFSASYDTTNRGWVILDSPLARLYSEVPEHYDADAFFDWFYRRAFAFAQGEKVEADSIIQRLLMSQSITMQHLGYLLMLQNPTDYAEALFERATVILASPPSTDDRELLLRILGGGFGVFDLSQRDWITESIMNYPVDREFDERYWIYELLSSIPGNLRSSAVESRVAELAIRHGPYQYTPPMRAGKFHQVRSPVAKEELAQMTPEELYDYLVSNRTLREEWNDQTMESIGGAQTLAIEAGEVFAEHSSLYAGVLIRLAEDPANYIYLGPALNQIEVTAALADRFIDLAERVHQVEYLQLPLVRLLQKAVEVVTADQWERLQPVCLHLVSAPDPERDRFAEALTKGYSNTAVMEGINTTRGAMAEVLVRAGHRFWNANLQAALEQLADDPTVSVRAALLSMLQYLLHLAGWDTTFRIFRRAFRPDEPEFAEVGHFLGLVPDAAFETDVSPLLAEMRDIPSGPMAEFTGQLTASYVLRGLLPPDELDSILFGEQIPLEVKAKTIELIWRWASDPQHVEQCLGFLNKVVAEGDDALVHRLDPVFRTLRPADLPRARPFIGALLAHPARGESEFWILEYLEKALPIWPVDAFETLELVLARAEKGLEDRPILTATRSEAPLHIATFILETYPDLEARALDVLDQLIAFQWKGTGEFVQATGTL